MILNALADYYQRLANDSNSNIAPLGWFQGRLDYVVKLDTEGRFIALDNLKRQNGKRSVGRPTLLPCIGKQASKHANSGKDANLLWDNSSFVFGLGNKGDLKLESFISTIRTYLGDLNDEAVNALLKYLEAGKENASLFASILKNSEFGKEISEGRANISFSLKGDGRPFVFARPKVKERIGSLELIDGAPIGTCLISGKTKQPIELCHPVIKGVRKSKPTDPDPNYISFNEQAFNSFGKKQSANAPSSKKSVFAYTTALNHLLAKNSAQRMQVGDASTVFWAKDACDFESDFLDYLSPQKGEEAVSYGKIKGLLSAIKTGIPPVEEELPFYVLGLAPNASRISVRFWHDGNVKEIKERVAEHFQDIEMARPSYERNYFSIKDLLLATTRHSSKHPYGDSDDIVSHLAGDIFNAVIKGIPYPRTLLQKIVNRVKAEQGLCDSKGKRLDNVTSARAALLKGFLVRNARISKSNQQEVSMALDKTYDNIGYVLGRLFAILERIQEQAQGRGLNKTIRDTYFGAAASSPLVAFNRLNQLSVHHLAKIRNSGKSTVWLDKLLGEVNDLLPKEGIPPLLSLENQGRFSIGYYHQHQDFFKKKESSEEQGEKS